jgi:hypothetical protein
MSENTRSPNKYAAIGIWKLQDINSHINNGNWPRSFNDPNPPQILSSNYYTEAGLGDNLITTFDIYATITGVLS